mmetsp:Transcript_22816/g.31935  ORF Transcript_22816/g.31935 Transcript_22816/m.31935 type:complete len:267 (+) Transcript_22816:465-1265(+)
MALVAVASMISLFGVLITNNQTWLVYRQLVIPIVFFTTGSYFLYSMSRLYHLIKSLQQQRILRSLKQESKTAGSQLDHHPKSSRNNNITIAVSSSNLYNNENSANTISPRVASPHVTNQRSFPHSTPRYAPRQSLKHTSVNSEARQATSCNGAGGINTSQTTLRATSDNRKSDAAMLRKSKISAQSRARAVVEQRVLRKICVMRTIGFILIAPLTLLFASFALFFLQTEETREETWEENRNSYDVITDVLYYIMLFCNGYAIFYNH